jgi:hypothetical protein
VAGDVDALEADALGEGLVAGAMSVAMKSRSRSSFSNGDVAVTFPPENAQVRTLTHIRTQPPFGKLNEEER